MARRRRRRKRRRNSHTSKIKAIVKKEVGKTRESLRLVSYVPWSRMNDIMVADSASNSQSVCVYSLTGGLDCLLDTTQNPQTYVSKQLFTMLPSSLDGGVLDGVGQYGDGGTMSQMSGVGGVAFADLGNTHVLEGNQCYLKKFYARVAINNSTASVTEPTNMYIRCLVVETRRPLSSKALSQQILLQNHAVPARTASVTPSQFPTSALGYLNTEVIKKVYYDRVIPLNGGAGATGSMRYFKLKINIEKKAHWKYYYPTRDPVMLNQNLNYQGPFIYLIMWPSSSGIYGTAWDDDGIGENRLPAFTINSILTFYDD